MRTASKIIAILLALSLIGGLQNSSSAPQGTMDLQPVFMIIRLILVIIFAYFGWRPKKKNEKTEMTQIQFLNNLITSLLREWRGKKKFHTI
jgi:hypothetical protein